MQVGTTNNTTPTRNYSCPIFPDGSGKIGESSPALTLCAMLRDAKKRKTSRNSLAELPSGTPSQKLVEQADHPVNTVLGDRLRSPVTDPGGAATLRPVMSRESATVGVECGLPAKMGE